MDIEEIQRYMDVSLSHSVTIDVSEVEQAPGNLRTITIHHGNSVTIEFETVRTYVEGSPEGGLLKYIANYRSLEGLVHDLEEYLGKPVDSWTNFTAEPYSPVVLDEPDPEQNLKHFENAVRQGAVKLPHGAEYRLASPYWRHIAKYGEFRKDKIWEEQDEHLGLDQEEEERDGDPSA